MIENCLVTDNVSEIGGLGYATGFHVQSRFHQCTSTRNLCTSGGALVLDTAPASTGATLRNCIFWNDVPAEISIIRGSIVVSHSDVGGGWPGEGNIDTDPGFFTLAGFPEYPGLSSPCIDGGDPLISDGIWDSDSRWPDWFPNGERSDMGAWGGPGNLRWIP
ncbi:MAG: hypothetical protein CME06_03095 [Gemmatimonadetes bacterium]|nr:hypothetical protein [Gemmatimonadota bacterium]